MKMQAMFAAAAFAALAACSPPAAKTEAPTAETASAPAAAPLVVDAPAGTYGLDLSHASLTWKVGHMGLSDYTARFAKFDAKLEIDPANPAAAKLTATIDPTSIRTDYPGDYKATHKGSPFKSWDEDLAKNEKWFNATKFPAITFTSTAVEMTGQDTAKVTGDLAMLGVTKPVTLDVKFNGSKNPHPFAPGAGALGFSATGSLKRSDWGMVNYIGGVDDEVSLLIEAEFIQVVTPAAAAKAG